MTTFDVRSRRSSIYAAAAAAEKITLRLHRGLPPARLRLRYTLLQVVRVAQWARSHPSIRPSERVRPTGGGGRSTEGARAPLARRARVFRSRGTVWVYEDLNRRSTRQQSIFFG